MKMNAAGYRLIKTWEGWRAKAYRDAVGHWTIGYGHTSMAGPPHVRQGMRITKEQGSEILKRDVKRFEAAVRPLIEVTLNDNQYAALVSFAYNVGVGNLKKSSVLRAVNKGDFEAVPRRLLLWNKAGGHTLRGLTRRRMAEGALFAKPPSTRIQNKQLEEAQNAGKGTSQKPGKPGAKSTTIAAAFGLLAAVLTASWDAMGEIFPKLLSFGEGSSIEYGELAILLVNVLATLATGWIVRERQKKSKEEGI